MSFPPSPGFPPAPRPTQTNSYPGFVPLRPLRFGEILSGAFSVAWRHIAALGPLAVLISALAAAVDFTLMSATGSLQTFASGAWLDLLSEWQATQRADGALIGVYLAVTVSSVVSIAGALWLSGVAAAYVSSDTVSRTRVPGLISQRLRARMLPALIVAVTTAVATMLGFFFLIAPGVLAFSAWALAAPSAVMEKSGPIAAFGRSARLSRGFRWRIIGLTLVVVVLTVLIDALISSTVITAMGLEDPVTALLVTDVVTAITAALTMPWLAAVLALSYVDIRMRREDLATALFTQATHLHQSGAES